VTTSYDHYAPALTIDDWRGIVRRTLARSQALRDSAIATRASAVALRERCQALREEWASARTIRRAHGILPPLRLYAGA
jgi:hypothetical protein